jgi:hypothetical protein
MGAPTSTSVVPVRPDFFSFIVTPSLQSEVRDGFTCTSRISSFSFFRIFLLFTTQDTPRGTYKYSPWLPGTGLGVMAMKEVYLLSVKSSCTRSGLISDISEVLSPFNVKILDVAQVLPFFLQRRSACPGGRPGDAVIRVSLWASRGFWTHSKVCPLPWACPPQPRARIFALSPFRPVTRALSP